MMIGENNQITRWSKPCGNCGRLLYYQTESNLNKSIKKNSTCRTCAEKIQILDSEWIRTCPICRKKLFYKFRNTFELAARKNSCCNKCSVEKSGINRIRPVEGIWLNEDKKWCRECPYCKTSIAYATRHGCKHSHALGKKCHSCFVKGQLQYLAKLKRDMRIEKVCHGCQKTFWVPPSLRNKKCCSEECRCNAIRAGKINTGMKGKGMSSERLKIVKKHKKYKDYEDGYDYTVEELRDRLDGGECFYCHRKEWLGLDRINNNQGHTKDNTIVACDLCNMTRGRRFSVEEMKVIGDAIRSLNITDRRFTRQNSNTNLWKKQDGKSSLEQVK